MTTSGAQELLHDARFPGEADEYRRARAVDLLSGRRYHRGRESARLRDTRHATETEAPFARDLDELPVLRQAVLRRRKGCVVRASTCRRLIRRPPERKRLQTAIRWLPMRSNRTPRTTTVHTRPQPARGRGSARFKPGRSIQRGRSSCARSRRSPVTSPARYLAPARPAGAAPRLPAPLDALLYGGGPFDFRISREAETRPGLCFRKPALLLSMESVARCWSCRSSGARARRALSGTLASGALPRAGFSIVVVSRILELHASL